MASDINPAASHHLPFFITAPGQTDTLFNVMAVVVVVMIVLIGVFYFRLHSLPEHMAHRGTKIQYEFVAVLGLLSLFTHNHAYWIAGLLLAFIELPDFTSPLRGMAHSLDRIADTKGPPNIEKSPDPSSPQRPSQSEVMVAEKTKELSNLNRQ